MILIEFGEHSSKNKAPARASYGVLSHSDSEALFLSFFGRVFRKIEVADSKEESMSYLTVADLMTDTVFCLTPEDPLIAARDIMDRYDIRHVPIVDEDKELIGILSLRDLARILDVEDEELPLSLKERSLRTLCVSDAMRRDVAFATPGQDLSEVALQMLEMKFGCLPVLQGRQVVGIVTESDFVRYVAEKT